MIGRGMHAILLIMGLVASTKLEVKLKPLGKEPIEYEWAGNTLDVSDYIYESGDINDTIGEIKTSNVNELRNDDVSTGVVSHGAPLNPAYPIAIPEGGSGGIDVPLTEHQRNHNRSIEYIESTSSNKLHEGSQDGGSGDIEQNANHTIRVLGVYIPCRKDTVATNTEDGDASGGAAANGSLPMRDSDVSRQQLQRELEMEQVTRVKNHSLMVVKQGNARTAAVQRPLAVPCITNPLTPTSLFLQSKKKMTKGNDYRSQWQAISLGLLLLATDHTL
ncbi:hypothetical protein Tco_0573754 [Tanacetum coccineum]